MDARRRIVQRVKKLLAIASGSTSAGEAANAMLKAQQLLAQHRLSPQEVSGGESTSVLEEEVFSAKAAPSWIARLHGAIAVNFRCHSIHNRTRSLGTTSLAFLGKAEDIEVAKAVFEYAVREGRLLCEASQANSKNSFLLGYSAGVAVALKNQREERSGEWGLALLPDQDVERRMASMNLRKHRASCKPTSIDAFSRGYLEGLNFTPNAIRECGA